MEVMRLWLTVFIHVHRGRMPPMSYIRPIESFCCQNPECALYGKRNAKNICQKGWSGKTKTIRMLYCKACKTRFSERKGTVLFNAHISKEKAIDILKHLADHNGTLQTSRLTGVYTAVVTRLARIAGEHAEKVHEELVAFSPLKPMDVFSAL